MKNYCDFCCHIVAAKDCVFVPIIVRKDGIPTRTNADMVLCPDCANALCDSTINVMADRFDGNAALARIIEEDEDKIRQDQEYADMIVALENKYNG